MGLFDKLAKTLRRAPLDAAATPHSPDKPDPKQIEEWRRTGRRLIEEAWQVPVALKKKAAEVELEVRIGLFETLANRGIQASALGRYANEIETSLQEMDIATRPDDQSTFYRLKIHWLLEQQRLGLEPIIGEFETELRLRLLEAMIREPPFSPQEAWKRFRAFVFNGSHQSFAEWKEQLLQPSEPEVILPQELLAEVREAEHRAKLKHLLEKIEKIFLQEQEISNVFRLTTQANMSEERQVLLLEGITKQRSHPSSPYYPPGILSLAEAFGLGECATWPELRKMSIDRGGGRIQSWEAFFLEQFILQKRYKEASRFIRSVFGNKVLRRAIHSSEMIKLCFSALRQTAADRSHKGLPYRDASTFEEHHPLHWLDLADKIKSEFDPLLSSSSQSFWFAHLLVVEGTNAACDMLVHDPFLAQDLWKRIKDQAGSPLLQTRETGGLENELGYAQERAYALEKGRVMLEQKEQPSFPKFKRAIVPDRLTHCLQMEAEAGVAFLKRAKQAK